MFCENCGNKLQDDAKMCNMCGKIVVPVEPIATPIVASVQAISNNSFVNNSSQEVSPVEDIQNINDIELSLDDINAEIEAIHEEQRVKRIKCYAMVDIRLYVLGMVSKDTETATVKMLQAVNDGRIIPVFSEKNLEECELLMRRERFGISENVITEFISNVTSYGVITSQDENLQVDTNGVAFYEIVPVKSQDANQCVLTPEELLSIIE